MIKNILFDLDGTLLPMDTEGFTKYYFGLLFKKVAPMGYDPEALIAAVWKGTAEMVANDGSKSNEEVFGKVFSEIMGEGAALDRPLFEDFYRNEFHGAKVVCGVNQNLIALVHQLKDEGYRIILATNPIFPEIATINRIRWAGFEPEDFEYITTYENFNYAKPNPEYYLELTRRLALVPEECLMVGNDVQEDMVAKTVGMSVYLLTDYILNRDDTDINQYPHGDYSGIRECL